MTTKATKNTKVQATKNTRIKSRMLQPFDGLPKAANGFVAFVALYLRG
jgi:hypothetical protein